MLFFSNKCNHYYTICSVFCIAYILLENLQLNDFFYQASSLLQCHMDGCAL
ncbi:hypothetical protein CLOSTMETH_02053 [[Clostridium] methylpentosum DSM 5476]|uniref:Uncharacterized protein n=1 Tax=[Clostridium] methylpentosum DSM 5476 TaxID=537013 RepID=C0EDX5_9FIRM|nr:hypothetical protein CLOSTMETH_02053 [[Clostridium] methylpentosum DSM 5476]